MQIIGIIFKILVASLLIHSLAACKKSRPAGLEPLVPTQVQAGAGDAVSTTRWGIEKAVNLATQTLFVQLDYTPPAKAGSAALPTCLEWLTPDFVLGSARCVGSDDQVEVKAKHVRQSCLAFETSLDPAESLALTCDNGADVFSFNFDPELIFGVSGPSK